MKELEFEIIAILNKIDRLDSKTYSFLIKNYNETLVNKIIEKNIDMNVDNIYKYEYYISKVKWVDNVVSKSLYDAYMIDLGSLQMLSKEKSRELAVEIYEIVSKLREKLDISENVWISDEVERFLENTVDSDLKKEIEKLYNKFIYKRNLLVESNLKFVIFVSKKYLRNSVDVCDIIQYGNIGLMRACEKFDPSYNSCFTTYSYYWIKQVIFKELNGLTCAFEISYNMISFNISMRKVINEFRGKYKREPLIHEIANEMKESVDKIRTCLFVFSETYSLDEPIKMSDDETFTRLDSLEDKNADSFNILMQKDMSDDLMEFLKNNLTEKEFLVICHRKELFGYDHMKLQALGDMFGVSRERIRQIESKVEKKIKTKGRYLSRYVD